VFIILLFSGALLTGHYMDIVWNIGDSFNAVMAFPNLLGLLFLANIVAKITKKSFKSENNLTT